MPLRAFALAAGCAGLLAAVPAPAPAAPVRHVAWVVFENQAPRNLERAAVFQALKARYGAAVNMHGITHPSLPNYLALTSGSLHGVTDDAGPQEHPLPGPSIFSQARGSWRSLQDGMPGRCVRADAGDYAVRHNPAVYYTALASQCARRSVPLDVRRPDLSAKFTFITPSSCHSMHSNSCPGHEDPVRQGDIWLGQLMAGIRASRQWQSGSLAVFVTFDEDGSPFTAANRIVTLAVAPGVRHAVRTRPFTHCHLLRAAEDLLGFAPLGCAASAPGLAGAFGLRRA